MLGVLRTVAALLLVLTLGLHWAVLQSVAWAAMIVDYSRDGTFTEAVAMTFDGKHPCCLCKAIKKARAGEKQQNGEPSKSGTKLEPGLLWEAPLDLFAPAPPRAFFADASADPRRDPPPKPRPRTSSSNRPV